MKRDDYISWDEYFMGVAKLAAMRSKDPNTQVGSCIVSEDNNILSMGYNGFPKGCSDDPGRERPVMSSIPSIPLSLTRNSTPSSITEAAALSAERYMYLFSRVTSAPRRSFRPGYGQLSTTATNTRMRR